jgi:NADH dehydrogenase [ubiquinone] 1 alpha subcomplex assembly factor 1
MRWNDINTPGKPLPMIRFDNPDAIDGCKVMTDQEMGGFTEAHLSYIPEENNEPSHGHFHGKISTELPKDAKVHRSGFAYWRTLDPQMSLFGKSLFNVDPYQWLGLRVKSDGRRYFVNVQTESIIPTDIYQHRLYTNKVGEWETVYIRWNDFVRTNLGAVVEPQKDMLKEKVRTVGIGLTDGLPGEFDLRIAEIWATNAVTDKERERAEKVANMKWYEVETTPWKEMKNRKQKENKEEEKILI